MDNSISSDFILSLQLQQQLDKEENSVLDENKKNLIDPSWELIDPTPNIYSLFIQFDKRFFWNKLNAIIVKWSKRMTTCAGICRYEGRGGACTISLSEPLLKLRPRKDLIETLLHEMIHAYLFVTHNNRDRDGHGPEFHKHMYRINNEAGTNITVYHDFHDEVRLYKTHWWRCNGPCQHQRPFFGMVKRASNRAPGPNDRWWAQHQSTCNGIFIKIREPDKKSKKPGELATNSIPATDIRKYLQDSNNQISVISGLNKIRTIEDLSSRNKNISQNSNPNQNKLKPPQNIQTLKNINNKSKTSGNALLNKGSGTILVRGTKNDKKNENDSNPLLNNNNFQPFSGNGYSLISQTNNGPSDFNGHDEMHNKTTKSTNSEKNKQVNVRDFWANKYPTNNTTFKRHITELGFNSPKKMKSNNMNSDEIFSPNSDNELLEATQNMENKVNKQYNNIRDSWANKYPNNTEKQHISQSIIKSQHSGSINESESTNQIHIIDLCEETNTICPICSKVFHASEINTHIDSCLESSFNDEFEDLIDIETNTKSQNKRINCLVCNKLINETQLNAHLEICMTNVFEDEITIPENCSLNEFENKKAISNSQKQSKVNEKSDDKIVSCPCCPRLVKESEINAHLDVCVAF